MKTFFLEFGRCTGPIILPNLRRFTVQGDTSSFRQLFVARSRMLSAESPECRGSCVSDSESKAEPRPAALFQVQVSGAGPNYFYGRRLP